MKKWTKVTLTILSTLAISVASITTYKYLQPSHYEGETFNNEQSTTISDVSTNTSVTIAALQQNLLIALLLLLLIILNLINMG